MKRKLLNLKREIERGFQEISDYLLTPDEAQRKRLIAKARELTGILEGLMASQKSPRRKKPWHAV